MIDDGSTLPDLLKETDVLLSRQDPHKLKSDTRRFARIKGVQRDLLRRIDGEIFSITHHWSPEQYKDYASTCGGGYRRPPVPRIQEYGVQKTEMKDGELVKITLIIIGFRHELQECLDLLERIRTFPSVDALLEKKFDPPQGYLEAFGVSRTGSTDARESQIE